MSVHFKSFSLTKKAKIKHISTERRTNNQTIQTNTKSTNYSRPSKHRQLPTAHSTTTMAVGLSVATEPVLRQVRPFVGNGSASVNPYATTRR